MLYFVTVISLAHIASTKCVMSTHFEQQTIRGRQVSTKVDLTIHLTIAMHNYVLQLSTATHTHSSHRCAPPLALPLAVALATAVALAPPLALIAVICAQSTTEAATALPFFITFFATLRITSSHILHLNVWQWYLCTHHMTEAIMCEQQLWQQCK